jgi:hypothetical protein
MPALLWSTPGKATVTSPLPTNKESLSTGWWSGPLSTGLVAYALTSSVVILGASFGYQFVLPLADAKGARQGLLERFSLQSGNWYKMIATSGYHYNPNNRSPVAFFPLYPLLGAAVIQLTGLGPTQALVVVSHACLAAAFVVAAAYLRGRQLTPDQTTASLTLLAMGLMPTTLFFRMTFSEPTFLLICLLFLLGLQRGWPLLVVALIAGLASASRPVGVGLLVPLLVYSWRRSPSRRAFLTRTALASLVGCWGLLAYAAFLYAQFGDPLVFAKAQAHWGSDSHSLTTKVLALASYQPIWDIFLRAPDAEWSMFNWELVNPAYFIASVAIFVFGKWRSWLNTYEALLAGVLLSIPYLTRAYEMSMGSHARFAAVIFPLYLVLGEGLARLPVIVAAALLGISAFFLGAYSALFVGGYPVF